MMAEESLVYSKIPYWYLGWLEHQHIRVKAWMKDSGYYSYSWFTRTEEPTATEMGFIFEEKWDRVSWPRLMEKPSFGFYAQRHETACGEIAWQQWDTGVGKCRPKSFHDQWFPAEPRRWSIPSSHQSYLKSRQNKTPTKPKSANDFGECITQTCLWSLTRCNITVCHLKSHGDPRVPLAI